MINIFDHVFSEHPFSIFFLKTFKEVELQMPSYAHF